MQNKINIDYLLDFNYIQLFCLLCLLQGVLVSAHGSILSYPQNYITPTASSVMSYQVHHPHFLNLSCRPQCRPSSLPVWVHGRQMSQTSVLRSDCETNTNEHAGMTTHRPVVRAKLDNDQNTSTKQHLQM